MVNNTIIARKNIVSGIMRMLVTVFLPFLLRTVMIYSLGSDYLGLNSLFSSILSVLNLAELGFSSAIVYCMYEPIVKGDNSKVNALLAFYRKTYFCIGIVVLCIGLIITPFVKHFIFGSWPENTNIYLVFLVYLINAAISYFFFAYKSVLLNALKRVDVINFTQIMVLLVQYMVQIIVLVFFRNYYIYIIVIPLCSVLFNLLIEYRTQKQYPAYTCAGNIDFTEKKKIVKSVKSVFLYRVSEVTRNSIDTIVISSFYGLVTAAIYNNYYYIFTAVYGLMVVLNQSIQAIVGTNIVMKKPDNNLNDMRKYNTYIMWLVSWFTVCMICLYQPFMSVWMGENMKLSNISAILLGVYFYVLNMNNIKNLYFDGNGLWSKGKITFILEIIGNLVLNIVLGKMFGTTGIILATIITIFFFSFIWRTKILFRSYFKCSFYSYMMDHIRFALCTVTSGGISYLLCSMIHTDNNWVIMMWSMIICVIVPNIVLFIGLSKNEFMKAVIISICKKVKVVSKWRN